MEFEHHLGCFVYTISFLSWFYSHLIYNSMQFNDKTKQMKTPFYIRTEVTLFIRTAFSLSFYSHIIGPIRAAYPDM